MIADWEVAYEKKTIRLRGSGESGDDKTGRAADRSNRGLARRAGFSGRCLYLFRKLP
jgi:hypothetical protein